MRAILIAALCIVLPVMWAGGAHAVGLYVVGKEDCNCSPLVAKGIVPDTLNTLKEALLIPHISVALDRLALSVQSLLAQAKQDTVVETAEIKDEPAADKTKAEAEKPAAKETKPVVDKPAKEKKPVAPVKDTTKKKKRVKMPPRTI